MPKTKFQDLIFTLIMVVTMVYCMTCYNMVVEVGLHYSTFLYAIRDMWPEALGAFIAQRYIAGPLAKKQVSRHFTMGKDKPLLITVAMAGFTVSMMAPIMTLYVSILHNGFGSEVPLIWLEKLAVNFPAALFLQIFYVGPFVRLVFRQLFKKQLQDGKVFNKSQMRQVEN
ncbi:DUF2798 domain-containing protein [Paenibacillus pinistramenti]|uniref:DUF2798 domain-containing protein n=1 Tax=Paenibacillus pinistramenti TaxID=1768003 RepID=UPI001109D8FB|nr:DUF2798 domain-containing protein [Paenibacillus pinistramenti]